MTAANATIARNTVRKGAAKAVAATSLIKFAVTDFARPSAGAALLAHTAAFLDLSGMTDAKAFPKATAAKIIGARAVQYHMNNGNFEQGKDGLTLTEKGGLFFNARPLDAELVHAYIEVLTKGTLNDKVNVKQNASRTAL